MAKIMSICKPNSFALGYAARVEGFSAVGKIKYEVTVSGLTILQAFHEAKQNELETAAAAPRL
jgi:hypothetical protein